MEYALLYTFSTIPQTLAAALGVLAAFVLYRFESDSKTRWEDARESNSPVRSTATSRPASLNRKLR